MFRAVMSKAARISYVFVAVILLLVGGLRLSTLLLTAPLILHYVKVEVSRNRCSEEPPAPTATLSAA